MESTQRLDHDGASTVMPDYSHVPDRCFQATADVIRI
jgi:hypothetical protein